MAVKILVADDSPNIREVVKMSLESAGYTVILAADGEETLRLFASEKPDLMIVDVMMPKANGFQICRKVKTGLETAGTPVILLTAKSAQEDVFWGRDCGADEYITKPFSTRDLEQSVARLIKTRQEREAGRGGGVAEEHRRRREGGQASQIVQLDWDGRALDVFRKKYGEFKYGEALRTFQREAEKFLQQHKDPGPVEVHETSGLTVVLRGAAREALKGGQALAKHLNAVAGSLYAEEDRRRGFISFRNPQHKAEEQLPLVSFTPRLLNDLAA
jgi:DNA-binding response OmpR family regulator